MQLPARQAEAVSRAPASDQEIHDRIFDAILSRRLPPGARLTEMQLAELFGVSRTKVRQALARLTQDGVVEHRPNQGARVVIPSAALTRQVFELRAILEPAVAAAVAREGRAGDIARLRRHIAEERAAREAGDEAALIRLSGEFHMLLAELQANPMMIRMLRELEALTCLAILHYAPTGHAACLMHEHAAILQALADRDEDRAAALMREHLTHVMAELILEEAAPADWRLADALRPDAPAASRRVVR
jgi:DNA-binding GntR family transcriptional regulator